MFNELSAVSAKVNKLKFKKSRTVQVNLHDTVCHAISVEILPTPLTS